MPIPKVSFCFTTFKRPDVLIDTVKSILIQSFTDFEIIICDNDPEQSGSKIQQEIKDPRIRYYPNKENLGMKKSFNRSLEKSSGQYIVMIADDDPVYPDMLQTLTELEKGYPGYGMYIGGGDWYCTDPFIAKLFKLKIGTNTFLNNNYPVDHIWKLSAEEFVTGLFQYSVFTNYLWSSAMVKREVLIAMGGVPDYGTPFLGDYAYMAVMGSHSGAVVINKSLGRQTIHLGNFGRAQNDQIKQAVVGLREYVGKRFEQNKLPKSAYETMDKFLGLWVVAHLSFLFHYYKKHNLDMNSIYQAEKEVFKIPIVKKFHIKYVVKKNFPRVHDSIVTMKKILKF